MDINNFDKRNCVNQNLNCIYFKYTLVPYLINRGLLEQNYRCISVENLLHVKKKLQLYDKNKYTN